MNKVVISVRISHPTWGPGDITKLFDCQPDVSWTVGEERKSKTGKKLGGTYPDTYWCKNVSYEGDSLSTAIEKGLRIFDQAPNSSKEIIQSGGRVEFFIGWFFDSIGGDVLPWPVMRRLADQGIDLSFDIYGPEVRVVTGKP